MADITTGAAHFYLHIPFCAAKCGYCDFYSFSADEETRERYVRFCAERLQEKAVNQRWHTVYIGGGTPSVLSPRQMESILRAIQSALFPNAEVTVECNPSSVTTDLARALAACGVNRVSLGLQSAHAAERRWLGRNGDLQTCANAIKILQNAGFFNISLDVMLGLQNQTIESLTRTLQFCEAHDAAHISAYLLKVEAHTPFALRDASTFPDDGTQCDLYACACDWLDAHGYAQYEISNFARAGYRSRHNLIYWNAEPYDALGPSAHGFTQGERWHYERDIRAFLSGAPPIVDGEGGDFEEYAMLRLRLTDGLCGALTRRRFGHGIPEIIFERAVELTVHDLVTVSDDKIALTRKGFLLSNRVIAQLLA
ncbi:MAG: radical SAM family heme chaperone HemW [Oscillospiraceae bacterium]|nr:radical SAM family heme chaperone HemW [Oscillospiraceae bacterium]